MNSPVEFFTDDAGELSCMRLMSCMVVMAVLGVWVWCNISTGAYVPLGYGEAGIISAAVGSKAQNGSNRNATYSGVGGAIGSAVGKSIIGGNAGAAIGGAIGGGAGATIENKKR